MRIVLPNPLDLFKRQPNPLNPADLHKYYEAHPMATTPLAVAATQAVPHTSVLQKAENFLTKVGHFFRDDVSKGLAWAVRYAPSVLSLATLLFGSVGSLAPAVAALTLIQNSIISIEQKYAASGVQTGTGAQKLAEVLSLVSDAVISLLQQAGLTVNASYITSLVNIVVNILNIHPSSALTDAVSFPATPAQLVAAS